MAKIGDYVKLEPVFPEAEVVKSDDLVGELLTLKAFAELQGSDNKYLVIEALNKKNLISFSNGGSVVMTKIKKLAEHFELKPDDAGICRFPEDIECVFVKKKSKSSGRMYHDLVDTDEAEEEN